MKFKRFTQEKSNKHIVEKHKPIIPTIIVLHIAFVSVS